MSYPGAWAHAYPIAAALQISTSTFTLTAITTSPPNLNCRVSTRPIPSHRIGYTSVAIDTVWPIYPLHYTLPRPHQSFSAYQGFTFV